MHQWSVSTPLGAGRVDSGMHREAGPGVRETRPAGRVLAPGHRRSRRVSGCARGSRRGTQEQHQTRNDDGPPRRHRQAHGHPRRRLAFCGTRPVRRRGPPTVRDTGSRFSVVQHAPRDSIRVGLLLVDNTFCGHVRSIGAPRGSPGGIFPTHRGQNGPRRSTALASPRRRGSTGLHPVAEGRDAASVSPSEPANGRLWTTCWVEIPRGRRRPADLCSVAPADGLCAVG